MLPERVIEVLPGMLRQGGPITLRVRELVNQHELGVNSQRSSSERQQSSKKLQSAATEMTVQKADVN